MRINKLATWICTHPLATWVVITVVVLLSGAAIMAVASATGVLLTSTGQAPVVLVHATPGLGR
jgi:hypothetical protein